MPGLSAHFLLTLRLNLKSRQALIYGYLVPIFFLIAFGSIFRSSSPPLMHQLGQLLTISVLGGACFGMPTALVAERERGIWRRYRLLPAATGSLVISTMAARFVIVLSAAVMQIFLAKLMYGMPLPEHPLQLGVAFAAVTFAFLGMGLIIAMLAENVPAVQALGQAIFLPMIMIGGVGVPLWALPPWAQHVAAFLPGKYAVDALDAAINGAGLGAAGFDLLALLVIGVAACVAGSKMFRWDAHEKMDPRHRAWIALAFAAWIAVGITAETAAHVRLATAADSSATSGSFETITQQQIDSVSYDGLPDDDNYNAPVVPNFSDLTPRAEERLTEIRRQLAAWPPAAVPDLADRTRNLLSAASVVDISEDRDEALFAAAVFEKLQADVPAAALKKVLTWIILHPAPTPPVGPILAEFHMEAKIAPEQLAERDRIYATKLLGRLTGKRPAQKE